jgi:hypothetical protein
MWGALDSRLRGNERIMPSYIFTSLICTTGCASV